MRREVVTIPEGMRIDGLSLSLYLSTVLLPLCSTCTGTCTMWMGLFLTKKSQKKIKKLIISKLLIRLVLSYEIFIQYILKALKPIIVFGSLAGCVLDDQLQISPDEPLDS